MKPYQIEKTIGDQLTPAALAYWNGCGRELREEVIAEVQHNDIDAGIRLVEEWANACNYCGGNCPDDEAHACDGYLGDVDGLYSN
jgi:hypothetical protein